MSTHNIFFRGEMRCGYPLLSVAMCCCSFCYSPPPIGGGHIVFGVYPIGVSIGIDVCISVASVSYFVVCTISCG